MPLESCYNKAPSSVKLFINNSFPSSNSSLRMAFFLPADGTLVPKHVADKSLMFLLTETVYLVGAINGVL